jgi:asparagine synthase (glutamine-hydrolysing)
LKHENALLDESQIVKKLLTKYNDKCCFITIDKSNTLKNLISNIRSLEFPIWDISSVAYSEVYKRINISGYKVVIEGHGSDEQLGGYDYLINSAFLTYIYKLNIKKAFQILHLINNLITKSPLLRIFFIIEQTIKSFVKKFKSDNEPFFFNEKVKASFDYKILPIVLRAFDRLTMKHSIENRCPFLDYRVVEFLRRLPIKYKINSLGSKAILKEILKKYGNSFVYKSSKKIGFGSDLKNFFEVNKKQIKKIILKSDLANKKKYRYAKILQESFISEKKYNYFSKILQILIFNKLFNLKNS